jgi:hypothetical protein
MYKYNPSKDLIVGAKGFIIFLDYIFIINYHLCLECPQHSVEKKDMGQKGSTKENMLEIRLNEVK